MKCKSVWFSVLLFLSSFSIVNASENELFEGNQRLACEALLCLTVGWGESECRPAIRKFFSIWSWKPSSLFSKRMNFLGLCPSGMSSSKQQLIVNYSGRCQGQRFTNYVSAYRSYTTVETENGGSMTASCYWHDKRGLWMHSQGQTACVSRLSYSDRVSRGNQDCMGFWQAFEVN